MKRFTHIIISPVRLLAMLFLIAIFFSACNKDHVNDYQHNPVSGLMAFNLATDQPAVGFALSGNRFGNTALGYTNYTGTYLPVYTGTREVRSFDYNTGSTLAISNNNFEDSGYYSTFLLGANGNYRNLTAEDKLAALTAATGKAWVRYINAVPDSTSDPVVSISSGGDNTISEPAAYATLSEFKQVNAGTVNTAINNGSDIAASRAITLEENKIYTLLFTGQPGQTDTSKAVHVRFIQNGFVTP